jgi:hypothetical protein
MGTHFAWCGNAHLPGTSSLCNKGKQGKYEDSLIPVRLTSFLHALLSFLLQNNDLRKKIIVVFWKTNGFIEKNCNFATDKTQKFYPWIFSNKNKMKMRHRNLFIVIHNQLFISFLCMMLCLTNVSAQVHIGADRPPKPSAMLEISSADKGMLFPAMQLTAINDTAIIEGGKSIDGLLIYNTTEDLSLNLSKGLYAWNSVKHLWEKIVSEPDFHTLLSSYYAVEEPLVVANQQKQEKTSISGMASNTTYHVTFPNDIITVNIDSCYKNNEFIAPADGFYKIICGLEVYALNESVKDELSGYLFLTLPNGQSMESATVNVIRSNIKSDGYSSPPFLPLSLSIYYNDYLDKGTTVHLRATAKSGLSTAPALYINRKYFYVNEI